MFCFVYYQNKAPIGANLKKNFKPTNFEISQMQNDRPTSAFEFNWKGNYDILQPGGLSNSPK